MRNRKAKKIIKIILSIFIVIALVNTAYWLYFTKIKFAKFEEAANGSEGKTYDKNSDYYVCVVPPEGIWGYHCELEVVEEIKVEGKTNQKKNTNISLMIFPKIFGGYDTKCTIDDNGTGEVKSDFHEESVQLELTENMELKSGNKEAYQKFYDKIYDAYTVANDVYGIYTLPEKK